MKEPTVQIPLSLAKELYVLMDWVPDSNYIPAAKGLRQAIEAAEHEIHLAIAIGQFHEAVMSESIPPTEGKGTWFHDYSSGYYGFRCDKCKTWVYQEQPLKCRCDDTPQAITESEYKP